jgi:membrane associated rhomboid family serine protease
MAYRSSFSFGYGLTPWVQRLIIINTVVFVITFVEPRIEVMLGFVPRYIIVQPWTLVTYMFAHGSFMHLLFNMLGLFFFGPSLEARWGSREFFKFYLLCGLGGALLSFVFALFQFQSANAMIIGASGAVFGIMLAFAMNWPDAPIYIWGIFPVPAKWLVAVLALMTLFSAFGGSQDGVAHFAHLGGFVAAFLYMKWDRHMRLRPASRLRNFIARRRLTVVPGGAGRSGRTSTGNGPGEAQRNEQELLDELDRVLDKISATGMASLTAAERKLLDDASRWRRQN